MVERGPEKAGVGGSIPSLGISPEDDADFLIGDERFVHALAQLRSALL